MAKKTAKKQPPINIHARHTLYVFVRTELPSMTPGKAQAHSGHAASLFARDCQDPGGLWTADHTRRLYAEWEGDRGFGTQINLQATWDEIEELITDDNGAMLANIVIDPTYPYMVDLEMLDLIDPMLHTIPPIIKENHAICFRKESTAAYIFCEENNTPLKDLLSKYPLHP